MNNITVNMDNLTTDERNTLLKLIEKANKPKNKAWKPEIGERYYCIRCDTWNMINSYNWNDDSYDKRCYEIGNCFRTKEEAEFALEKQKVFTELKRFALENNECELDWNDNEKSKYFIVYNNYLRNKIQVESLCYTKYGGNNIYFSSMKVAKKAIEIIGEDRLKKYYFEVNDNE